MPKALTRDQIQKRKEQAARFVEGVLGDPDRADEIRDESVDDYAERRRFQIIENPQRGVTMPSKTELMQRIRELEEENDDLQDQLDQVADIVAPPEEEGEDEDGDGDDQGEQ